MAGVRLPVFQLAATDGRDATGSSDRGSAGGDSGSNGDDMSQIYGLAGGGRSIANLYGVEALIDELIKLASLQTSSKTLDDALRSPTEGSMHWKM